MKIVTSLFHSFKYRTGSHSSCCACKKKLIIHIGNSKCNDVIKQQELIETHKKGNATLS